MKYTIICRSDLKLNNHPIIVAHNDIRPRISRSEPSVQIPTARIALFVQFCSTAVICCHCVPNVNTRYVIRKIATKVADCFHCCG